MQKAIFIAILGLGCGAGAPVWSQNATSPPGTQNGSGAGAGALGETPVGVSVASLLQLQPAQVGRLSRLAEEFAARSRDAQAKIAGFQAPSASTSADSRATREADARHKCALDLAAIRAQARQVLPPVQRSQLDSLAGDPRFRVRRDGFYQLLLAPLDESVLTPALASIPGARGEQLRGEQAQDEQSRRNWLQARRLDGQGDFNRAAGVGSYGVYSGYGYGGPQFGVYGGYQQGAVGVHAGVGRGGPSIGINIGRVFGIGRR